MTAADAARVRNFVNELRELCRKHGLSISHEDSHGAFQVYPWDESHDAWLAAAYVPEDVVLAAAAPTAPRIFAGKHPNPNNPKES